MPADYTYYKKNFQKKKVGDQRIFSILWFGKGWDWKYVIRNFETHWQRKLKGTCRYDWNIVDKDVQYHTSQLTSKPIKCNLKGPKTTTKKKNKKTGDCLLDKKRFCE